MIRGISPHRFALNLDSHREWQIAPPVSYPKYEVEFYDILKSCANRIDKIHGVQERIKFTSELNRIFPLRDTKELMKLFIVLVTLDTKKGG